MKWSSAPDASLVAEETEAPESFYMRISKGQDQGQEEGFSVCGGVCVYQNDSQHRRASLLSHSVGGIAAVFSLWTLELFAVLQLTTRSVSVKH